MYQPKTTDEFEDYLDYAEGAYCSHCLDGTQTRVVSWYDQRLKQAHTEVIEEPCSYCLGSRRP